MAVTLPPWLNIDPTAPARLKLQANAQRNAAAASTRAAQAQAEDLQFRREQAASHEAAQERAEQRRERVFKQTQDQELAQAAQQIQLRREAQAAKTAQFEQQLRLKQQAAEQEAKSAALQMQGLRAVQKGLQEGQPLQKLISENAPLIFAKHPERMPSAVPKAVAGPSDLIARELTDESGNPLGVRVIPGAHGAIKPLPRTTMSPEGMLRADQLRLGVISKQLEEADPSSPEYAKLTQARDAIMGRLEQITSRRRAASPGTSPEGALLGAPPAASAPSSDTVRVKSPDGKTGIVPRAEWEASSPEERKGWEEISPTNVDEEEEAPEETEPEEEE